VTPPVTEMMANKKPWEQVEEQVEDSRENAYRSKNNVSLLG
jgi:hypothetical protein